MAELRPNSTSPSASSSTPSEQSFIPDEVTASVTYAKISSDYLRGRAGSVQDMAKSVQQQIIRANQTSAQDMRRSQASASEALDNARRNLLHNFRQFESDSTAWAVHIRKGYKIENGSNSVRVQCPREASEILRAVQQARREVYPAIRPSPPLSPPRFGGKETKEEPRTNGRTEAEKAVGDGKICGCFCSSSE